MNTWSNFSFDPNTPNVIAQQNMNNAEVTQYTTDSVVKWSLGSECPENYFQSCPYGPRQTPCNDDKDILIVVNGVSNATMDTSVPCGCSANVERICETPDTTSMCKLGNNGTGECRGSCAQGTDYGTGPNFSSTNPQNLWIYCDYKQDYNDFFLLPSSEINAGWLDWITDVYLGMGSNSNANRIRDSHVVYAYIVDLFNKMYSDGYYASDYNSNDLQRNLYTMSFTSYLSELVGIYQIALQTSLYPVVTPEIVNILL